MVPYYGKKYIGNSDEWEIDVKHSMTKENGIRPETDKMRLTYPQLDPAVVETYHYPISTTLLRL